MPPTTKAFATLSLGAHGKTLARAYYRFARELCNVHLATLRPASHPRTEAVP